jgi:hypothetical protein
MRLHAGVPMGFMELCVLGLRCGSFGFDYYIPFWTGFFAMNGML